MRPKFTFQPELDFHPSNLQVTNEYYEKYQAVSRLLDENREILDLLQNQPSHCWSQPREVGRHDRFGRLARVLSPGDRRRGDQG